MPADREAGWDRKQAIAAETQGPSDTLTGNRSGRTTPFVHCYSPISSATAAGRRPLSYVITAKGELGSGEPLRVFRWHLVSSAVSVSALIWAFVHSSGAPSIRFWAVFLGSARARDGAAVQAGGVAVVVVRRRSRRTVKPATSASTSSHHE